MPSHISDGTKGLISTSFFKFDRANWILPSLKSIIACAIYTSGSIIF